MEQNRKRPLVINDETGKHRFRQSLPTQVLALTESSENVSLPANDNGNKTWLNEDVHLFLLSFIAFFTAFYLFIF